MEGGSPPSLAAPKSGLPPPVLTLGHLSSFVSPVSASRVELSPASNPTPIPPTPTEDLTPETTPDARTGRTLRPRKGGPTNQETQNSKAKRKKGRNQGTGGMMETSRQELDSKGSEMNLDGPDFSGLSTLHRSRQQSKAQTFNGAGGRTREVYRGGSSLPLFTLTKILAWNCRGSANLFSSLINRATSGTQSYAMLFRLRRTKAKSSSF